MSTTIFVTSDSFTGQWKEYGPQSFNLTDINGNPVTIFLEDIRSSINYSAVESVAYGLAIGLCSTLLIAMIALQERTKLRRPIFLLNILSLFLVSLRGIVSVIILNGPFVGMEQMFLGVNAQYANIASGLVIISAFIQLFLYASILATLTLQVRVIFSGTRRNEKIITIILSAVAMVLLGFELGYVVLYLINIFEGVLVPQWVVTTIEIFFVIFVSICSLTFLFKLAVTIRRRRSVGVTKFGPLQILFIMSCQCLVAPRIPTLVISQTDRNSYFLCPCRKRGYWYP